MSQVPCCWNVTIQVHMTPQLSKIAVPIFLNDVITHSEQNLNAEFQTFIYTWQKNQFVDFKYILFKTCHTLISTYDKDFIFGVSNCTGMSYIWLFAIQQRALYSTPTVQQALHQKKLSVSHFIKHKVLFVTNIQSKYVSPTPSICWQSVLINISMSMCQKIISSFYTMK